MHDYDVWPRVEPSFFSGLDIASVRFKDVERSDKPIGVNRSLEFESSCRKDRLKILGVAERLDELVLVISIDLQNYAMVIPF